MPTFATPLARAKMEQLMQPALIRVIDNIRKQLDISDWQGRYEEELIWPVETTPAEKQEYAALQKSLHGVPPDEHDRVSALMSQLPQPRPLYTLRLKKPDQQKPSQQKSDYQAVECADDCLVDIWTLCYRVCSHAFQPQVLYVKGALPKQDLVGDIRLEPDDSLFDSEGSIDWLALDEKTKGLVEDIFKNLPD